jgi:hypothetical protein
MVEELGTLADRVQAARSVAHRAVTESVNIVYVDLLRRACYEMCDLSASLLIRLAEAEENRAKADEAWEREWQRAVKAEKELTELREALEWIYAEPEDPAKVQSRAYHALKEVEKG